MRVVIKDGENPHAVDIIVTGAGLGVPAELRLTPDHDGHPFATVPPGHRFEGYRGDFGAPRELLAVARAILAKRIDHPAGEAAFARILERWPATPLDATAEARLLQPERMERDYASVGAYQRDAAMLAKEGWQVAAVNDRRGPRSHMRGVISSWLGGRRRVAPVLVVSYRRHH
jgi:hypothetical protein